MARDTGEAARRIKRAWDDAEEKLKRTERTNGDLTIPAVNELRYAGFHVLEALTATTDAVAQENYEKAEKHCKRAGYDAVEAEILFHATQFRQFQTDYRTITINIPGVDYVAMRVRATQARDLMNDARRDDESRDTYYARILPHCDQLRADIELLTAARDELNKLLVVAESEQIEKLEAQATADRLRAEKAERRAASATTGTRRYWITTGIALIVVVIYGVGLWKSLHPESPVPPSAPART